MAKTWWWWTKKSSSSKGTSTTQWWRWQHLTMTNTTWDWDYNNGGDIPVTKTSRGLLESSTWLPHLGATFNYVDVKTGQALASQGDEISLLLLSYSIIVDDGGGLETMMNMATINNDQWLGTGEGEGPSERTGPCGGLGGKGVRGAPWHQFWPNVTLLASSPACYTLLLKNNDDILLTTTRWMEGCGAEETLVAGQQKLRAAITAVMALTKGKQLHPWINAGCLNNDLDNCTLSGGDDNNDAHQTIDTDFRARSLLNYRDRQKFPPLPPYLKTLPVIDRNFEVPVPATADE